MMWCRSFRISGEVHDRFSGRLGAPFRFRACSLVGASVISRPLKLNGYVRRQAVRSVHGSPLSGDDAASVARLVAELLNHVAAGDVVIKRVDIAVRYEVVAKLGIVEASMRARLAAALLAGLMREKARRETSVSRSIDTDIFDRKALCKLDWHEPSFASAGRSDCAFPRMI